MPALSFTATLQREEAVLRFPYDERLRRLLRAIPGRRWDPEERVWRVPLEAEQADALARLLEGLPARPEVEERLARTIERRRRRRGRRDLLVDLARPDERWWLSFATDGPPELLARLLDHPGAERLEPIGRAQVPLDERSAATVGSLRDAGVRLSSAAAQALRQRLEDAAARQVRDCDGRAGPAPAERTPREDVAFRRDRRGDHWILVTGRWAALARVIASRAGLRAADGPAGSVGLAANERDAEALAELLGHLEDALVEERVGAWLARARSWRGNIEVQGMPDGPALVLLGEEQRLPRAVRERASSVPGGVALPLTLESWRLARRQLDGWLSPAARRCGRALEEGRPAPPAVLELSAVHERPTFVLAPGHDASLAQAFAAIDGASAPRPSAAVRRGLGAHPDHGSLPAIAADPFCVPALDAFLAGRGVWVEDAALEALQKIREEHARAAGLVALSQAREADLDVPGLGGELKPFQRAGVAYLLERRRAFLADEQGLGKTIEALAALQAGGAFPAVVVCPANLKLNWLRETRTWLPGRSVRLLAGRGEGAGAAGEADVTIVNYEILGARLEELLATAPRAAVIDEAHLCKNAAAKRTQAVHRLAAAVPRDGLVLALSGTPVLNRPSELIAQLRILGRLEEFGSGAQFGARFKGPDAHQRLHWHLRARCFARRCKSEVLPQLPPKTRSVVPIELDNEAEYRLAEHDVVAWLRSQPLDLRELDAKVAAALRAERLVRLNALKLLAARGKLAAALSWIHDFRCSGERLVVFARHREIQRAVLERFPQALHILGEDSVAARDAALQSFQAPDDEGNGLIVCSLEVAGQGLTLTRASSVAFLELDWTPARHDQAEDRCHRIGQQDAVNAYYLLAAESVDETIARLLERKRAVIGAVTDGRDEDGEGVVDALVRELRGEPYRRLRAVA
ncbi:MAG TPA: DEAD/DEAH box helicase [Solirubrobacteraceae bacterium]|nr:DEAD/DEAH box helicase [Solirubrobacteraceae bacterium]